MPSSSGMSFTPHVIAVSIGEVMLNHYYRAVLKCFVFSSLLKSFDTLQQDIASKVISFSQQGPRAICVLSASGTVSTATLLQPSASPGAITYEVPFLKFSLYWCFYCFLTCVLYISRAGLKS